MLLRRFGADTIGSHHTGGATDIQVKFHFGEADENSASAEGSFQAIGAGVSIIPLLLILVLAVVTQMVEFALFSGVFVGACIVAGELNQGFKDCLEKFILEAVADKDHIYVVLFSLFLSGIVSMMQRSGGMLGFTNSISKSATTARSAQIVCMAVGVTIFFDDYANVLLAGQSMAPLMNLMSISREKFSFIVDATAAPVASLSPCKLVFTGLSSYVSTLTPYISAVSSWVGYEVGLIQEELDAIKKRVGDDKFTLESSGFSVFLQSIRYRYYPIFMLIFMTILIGLDRDFGSMLIAERKTRVYDRKDGGDGRGRASKLEHSDENQPHPATPLYAWNMLVPVALLIFFIFFLLVQSGEDPSKDQSFMDKIENSNSYVALLYGTMAASMLTAIFYFIQFSHNGALAIPNAETFREWMFPKPDYEVYDEPSPRSVLSIRDSVDSFVYGMTRVFPAIIVLNLAWASGSIMGAVGANRLFASWLTGSIAAEMLPTLSFLISFFIGIATGTSWGTMAVSGCAAC